MQKRVRQTEYLPDRGEILSRSDYLKEMLIFQDMGPFVKLFNLPKYDTIVHGAHFSKLIKYLEQNTNRLVVKKGGNHIPLKREDVECVLEVSTSSTFRFLRESHEKNIIVNCRIRDIDKGFYINPIYALNGSGMSVELYLLFDHDPKLQKAITPKDRKRINEYLAITGEK